MAHTKRPVKSNAVVAALSAATNHIKASDPSALSQAWGPLLMLTGISASITDQARRRTRHLFIRQQTAVINAIRAHLAEFGIVAPVGRHGVEWSPSAWTNLKT